MLIAKWYGISVYYYAFIWFIVELERASLLQNEFSNTKKEILVLLVTFINQIYSLKNVACAMLYTQ